MNCPSCAAKRTHTPEDWALHPYAGHGYAQGQGWTHPDLNPTQAVGDAGEFRFGDVFVSPAPLTGVHIGRVQELIPPQTIGRTPEWREQMGNLPPGARLAAEGDLFS